ncbi:hypothetical protein C8F04DRAFT_1177222 [Mycena alexandri]|uniref:Uncharacterized protein n=1 Tax=Mycena alexandri TaxID=1745969 RepID=A0AAD6T9A5_9AGAR|nr:hypothetical protein C8F04DRAFT_1177222 [Mycena alexandri]
MQMLGFSSRSRSAWSGKPSASPSTAKSPANNAASNCYRRRTPKSQTRMRRVASSSVTALVIYALRLRGCNCKAHPIIHRTVRMGCGLLIDGEWPAPRGESAVKIRKFAQFCSALAPWHCAVKQQSNRKISLMGPRVAPYSLGGGTRFMANMLCSGTEGGRGTHARHIQFTPDTFNPNPTHSTNRWVK